MLKGKFEKKINLKNLSEQKNNNKKLRIKPNGKKMEDKIGKKINFINHPK